MAQLTSDERAGVFGCIRRAEAAEVLLLLLPADGRRLDNTHTPKRGQSHSFKAAAAGRIQLIDMGALPPTQHQRVCPSAPGGAAHTGCLLFVYCSQGSCEQAASDSEHLPTGEFAQTVKQKQKMTHALRHKTCTVKRKRHFIFRDLQLFFQGALQQN